MNGEQWRSVFGFEDYEISDRGRVRSWKPRSKGKVLSPQLQRNGYLSLFLFSRHDGRMGFGVHRLVLEAFVGPPPTDKHEANHLNGDKQDNRVENLEWVTPRENDEHARAIGLKAPQRGEEASSAKLTAGQVREIRWRYAAGGITMKELARRHGVSETAVRNIVHRRAWAHVD